MDPKNPLLPRVRVAAAALKVFPLPSTVLFPGVALPLHIFEPRYLDLVRDALATDGLFALAHLKPGWEPEYHGRPALEELACAGVIAWHEKRADGRYDLVLEGVVRVRLVEELPEEALYREVRAELLPDPPYEGPEEAQLRRALLELAPLLPRGLSEPLMQRAAHTGGGALADLVAAAVLPDVEARREVLCELNPQRRLQQVAAAVAEQRVHLSVPGVGGPVN